MSEGNMKAFPNNRSEGMDLRDYFAAKAMAHWLSIPLSKNQKAIVAKNAYEVADAMIKQREKISE